MGKQPKRLLGDLYRKSAFATGCWAMLFNPFFFSRRELGLRLRALAPRLRGRLLDVGCGTAPYREFFTADEYIKLDVDTPETRARGVADVFFDGRHFPFADGELDGIVCSEVLEHVFHPDEFAAEMHRILAPDGLLLLTVPFVWAEHEAPYDFGRYSSFGLCALLERNGFAVEEAHKSCADFRTIVQLFNLYVYEAMPVRSPALKLVLVNLITAPANVLGSLLRLILPKNPGFYLDQILLARKTAPAADKAGGTP